MYKIGEFAKIINTTTKTIRYYDDEGILKPDYVDHMTGYRYYSVFKISEFNRIVTLKEIGFSLSEIREAINLKGDDEILGLIQNKRKSLMSEADDLNNRISNVKKMEEDFLKLKKVFEDQSQYKNKIASDDKKITIEFENHEAIVIHYECSSRDHLLFAKSLFLESINGFGLVNFDYAEIKETLTAGETAYVFKATPTNLQLYNDKDAKGFIIGFLIGNEVGLMDIVTIMEAFADALYDDALVMFTAVVDPKLEAKDIEIVLVSIK